MIHPYSTVQTEGSIPILPKWVVVPRPAETLEEAGFACGSALAVLHVMLSDPGRAVPADLLRSRLALRAAAASLKLEGRGQTEADIRDAYHLAALGDAMGPAGDMLSFWRSGLSLKSPGWKDRLSAMLPDPMRDESVGWMEEAQDLNIGPASQSLSVLTKVLERFPRQEAAAFLCADIVLARGLGWERPLPVTALHLKRSVLRDASDGADIRIAFYNAIARATQDAIRLTNDLARRAADLRSVAPKLRAKGSSQAVALFLSEDVVYAPTMLSPVVKGSNIQMTGRAARRLCDRLVELGVVRELTGRKTFRLYGVA